MKKRFMKEGGSPKENRERLARIFLKPRFWRYRRLIRLAETMIRPLVLFSKDGSPPKLDVPERILVFDPGGLGDMVLLIPFLRNLRTHFPSSRVVLLGGPESGAFLLDQGMVEERIPIDMPWGVRLSRWKRHNPFSLSWLRFLRELWRLRKQRFDLAFSAGWGGDLRGNLVIWLTGARRRVGYGYGGGEFLLTDVVEPDLARPHVANRNLHLLDRIGLPLLSHGETLTISPEDERQAAELLAQHGIGKEDLVIGIHPGAGSAVREWGDERFAEVARGAAEKFGAKILWFSDPVKPRPVPTRLDAISLTLSFREFAAVVCRCQLFLCNDSGPMHVAAALKVPVVAVFGPQRPEWFGPYGEGHRVVIRQDIWCRPCADHCIFEQPYCLRLISVDQVTQAVTDALKGLGQSYRCVGARG